MFKIHVPICFTFQMYLFTMTIFISPSKKVTHPTGLRTNIRYPIYALIILVTLLFFNHTSSVTTFNNSRCFLPENVRFTHPSLNLWKIARETSLVSFYNGLKSCYPIFNYTTIICNRSNMSQSMKSSVCISIHRLLMDNRYDCPLSR